MRSRHECAGARRDYRGTDRFLAPANQYFYLDHDQRVTFNTGFELLLPQQLWVSGMLLYGSGFLLGDGPNHLSPHTTGDVAVGKECDEGPVAATDGDQYRRRPIPDRFANSFAGTHYQNPREIGFQVRYKFKY